MDLHDLHGLPWMCADLRGLAWIWVDLRGFFVDLYRFARRVKPRTKKMVVSLYFTH